MPAAGERFSASYLIETPLEPRKVAEIMAGEQSCGTFTRVHGETDELRERACMAAPRQAGGTQGARGHNPSGLRPQ